jgi:pyridoxal 5'-phosphate synthase pdxT subunit
LLIGVLSLQGAFIEHRQKLNSIGVDSFEIRQLSDLNRPFDGLILPGGESTTMGRLLKDLRLFEPIKNLIESGLPTLGTCAGMILLANRISGEPYQYFSTLPIEVTRNYFGRQLGSFYKTVNFNDEKVDMTFIRAPIVSSVGQDVKVLIKVDDLIVAVQYKNQIALAFHPELGKTTFFHKELIRLINQRKLEN